MNAIAKVFGADRRLHIRHLIDYVAATKFDREPDLALQLANISATGFMTVGTPPMQRGEALLVELPVAGWRPCFVAWVFDNRTGFQFHQPIPAEPFHRMLIQLGPKERIPPE